MKFTQYYLDCLSQASYLIGDETTGRAVVVDPRRDIDEYVADARAAGLTIELVIETHFHADFLSGHLELAAATGAEIGYSSVATTEFPSRKLVDGERISLGDEQLEIRHTPGHTPESISVVVWEHADDEVPYGVLTGDALFIGDVGRPDLLASLGYTRDELADQLYEGLHTKLLTLPDATRVYPAHGAGSACGKNLSTETWSTIGDQRVENYALLAPDKATFVELVTEGQPPAPSYFVYDAVLNRQDRPLLDENAPLRSLDLAEVDALVADGAVLLDGRTPEEFAHGHLSGSINVGLDGRYAEFAGSVVPSDVDIVLVVEPGFEREGRNRLGRIGFDRVVGYLADPLGVMAANPDRTERASRLTVREFEQARHDLEGVQIVDIRNPGEIALGVVPGAVTIPVGQLPARLGELDPAVPTVVYCAGGYRSSVAASLLRTNGFADVSDLLGGFGAWVEVTQMPTRLRSRRQLSGRGRSPTRFGPTSVRVPQLAR
jgi:glyoxylase-like metal-dependent hydrolase (beta-lactamase superfamily II)/rhodanese-related sulfurtransferase